MARPDDNAIEKGKWLRKAAEDKADHHLLWPWGNEIETVLGDGRKSRPPNVAHYVVLDTGAVTKTPLNIMCTLAHGKPTVERCYAICTCDEYYQGCIAPAHVRWANATERRDNATARGSNTSGERHHRSKLTEAQVHEILSSHDRYAFLAHRFGVSIRTISDIRCGRGWKHVQRPPGYEFNHPSMDTLPSNGMVLEAQDQDAIMELSRKASLEADVIPTQEALAKIEQDLEASDDSLQGFEKQHHTPEQTAALNKWMEEHDIEVAPPKLKDKTDPRIANVVDALLGPVPPPAGLDMADLAATNRERRAQGLPPIKKV